MMSDDELLSCSNLWEAVNTGQIVFAVLLFPYSLMLVQVLVHYLYEPYD